jgi:hypothetical protein
MMLCLFFMYTDEELAQQVSLVAQLGGTENVSQEEANDMEMALAIFKSYQVSAVTCSHTFLLEGGWCFGLSTCRRIRLLRIRLYLINCKYVSRKKMPFSL